jgi:hypothetical protein
LIDVAISCDTNIRKKEVAKEIKYRFKNSANVVLVIIGTMGIVTKGLKKNL